MRQRLGLPIPFNLEQRISAASFFEELAVFWSAVAAFTQKLHLEFELIVFLIRKRTCVMK